MATRNILNHSAFPQVFQPVLRSELRHVGRVLHLCIYESPESSVSACDGGYPCHEDALPGEEDCLKHFQESR